MNKISIILIFYFIVTSASAQSDFGQIQKRKLNSGICLDFVRTVDLKDFNESSIQQIFIFRHAEPAMDKVGWKNRKEAIRFIEMYDSVGVYDFEQKPICLRAKENNVAYTSQLPRAINTAEKTFDGSMDFEPHALFNEFDRKIIQFPNIKLPMKFWTVTTRIVWMMGFNKKGIESFSEAKERSKRAAFFLNEKAEIHGKTMLFSHGFINKYIKRYLKQEGYRVANLNGKEYLGAYYFYK